MSEWIASARFARGAPDRVPETLPLPSVAEVLDAWQSAGCHGTNWFEIVGEETCFGRRERPRIGYGGLRSSRAVTLGDTPTGRRLGCDEATRFGARQSVSLGGDRAGGRPPVGGFVWSTAR